MRSALVSIAVTCLLAGAAAGEPPSVEQVIRAEAARARLAGVAAALIERDRVRLLRVHGWADTAGRRPVERDTPFLLASVSKAVTAVAAMQLVEQGKLALDDSIDRHLPFRVRHPRAPVARITVRMLMRHRSGIRDNADVAEASYTEGADSPLGLEAFLRDVLTPGGKRYDARRNFGRRGPGARYAYSNIGVALLALVVQRAAGTPFDQLCRERIFTPLGMRRTRWFLARLPVAELARPHVLEGGRLRPRKHYGFPDYPNGQLRSSVADLARFLMAISNRGRLGEVRLLQPGTVAAMLEQELIWYGEGKGAARIVGHEGGEDGALTRMFFRPSDGVGVIVLTNTSAEDEAADDRQADAVAAIERRLYAEAKRER